MPAYIEREHDAAVVKHGRSWSDAYCMEDMLSNRSRNLGESISRALVHVGVCLVSETGSASGWHLVIVWLL